MENTVTQDANSIELSDLLSTIMRHKIVISFITLLMVAFAVAYIATREKTYYAHSIILLEDQNKNLEMETLTKTTDIDALYISSEVQVLQSRELIGEVLNRMGVFDSPEILLPEIKGKRRKIITNDALINYVLKDLNIKQAQKSRAIEVGYSSHSKELSSWLVNMLVSIYIKKEVFTEKTELSSTDKWLRDRVKQLNDSVKKIELEIVEYRKKFNLIDSNGQNILENEIKQLSNNLINAQVALANAQVKWEELKEHTSLKTAPEVIKSNIIQRLIERQAISKDEVFRLNSEYGEDHPEMVSANNRLNSINQKIDLEIKRIAKSLEREYDIAKANVDEIKAQLDDLKNKYNQMGKDNITLSSLEREAQTRKELLNKLDARWKEIQIQKDEQVQAPNATILSKASTPTRPKGVSSKMMLIISLIGGAAMGLALAVALDYMQTNIYNGKQLQKYTGLPNISLIPKLRGAASSQIQRSVRQLYKAPLSDYSESLRSLTAHLKRYIKDAPKNRIFNFTSISKGDGKSALVAASACQMSLEGMKVLVIDCDLRNPSLGAAFNLSHKKGLSNLLDGSVKLGDVIYKDKDSSLDLIGIGTLNDINIIKKSAKKWQQILARASQDYDIIMLDGPPAQNISDMSILAQDSQNIICVRWKKTSIRQINYSQNLLESLNFSLLGTVITLVSPKKIRQLNKA